ncbi:unnamed protein product [Prorocentrum cordatum]|uniref:Uncharacterized protein n=1 Tax=Prorocentrum cordatum TaxID=2364126 RepID=A0ABN9VP40_9DINO|nr:unnamed protein product [Polarella glacialis]
MLSDVRREEEIAREVAHARAGIGEDYVGFAHNVKASGNPTRHMVNHLYRNEVWVVKASHESNREYIHDPQDECADYAADTGIINASTYPWHQLVFSKQKPAIMLYGTGYAQALIWKHQNPVNCTDAKFIGDRLIFRNGEYGDRYGMGAALHHVARALAIAMNSGRVLVFERRDRDPTFGWYERVHCKGTRGWDCWFVPVSHCEPVGDVVVIDPMRIRNLAFIGDALHQPAITPQVFDHMLRNCSPVKTSMYFYWWRAQAVTYLISRAPESED